MNSIIQPRFLTNGISGSIHIRYHGLHTGPVAQNHALSRKTLSSNRSPVAFRQRLSDKAVAINPVAAIQRTRDVRSGCGTRRLTFSGATEYQGADVVASPGLRFASTMANSASYISQ